MKSMARCLALFETGIELVHQQVTDQ